MDQLPNAAPTYLGSIARSLLAALGGWLLSKNVVTSDQSAEIAAAAPIVVAIVWSLVQKARSRAALKSAIAAPAGKAG